MTLKMNKQPPDKGQPSLSSRDSKIIKFPGNRTNRGFPSPKRKWNDRCKFCYGIGFVTGLRAPEPCTACSPPEPKEPLDCDTWHGLVHFSLLDAFGELCWSILQSSRSARLRARMIVKGVLNQKTTEPDAGELLAILHKAIPMPDHQTRELAQAIVNEWRMK